MEFGSGNELNAEVGIRSMAHSAEGEWNWEVGMN